MRRTWTVLLFAMSWPTVAAIFYFVMLASPEAKAHGPNPLLQGAYGSTKVIQFALPVVWLGVILGEDIRPARPNWRGLLPGIVFGLAVFAVMVGGYFGWLRDSALLQNTPAPLRAKVADFGAHSPLGFVLLGTFLTVIHSLLEEYYWRWFVFGQLDRLIPTFAAVFFAGFGFAAHHYIVLGVYFPDKLWLAALLALGIAVGGMFWCWLYHRTGTVWSAWLSHLIIDAAIMIVGYDLLFHHPAGR